MVTVIGDVSVLSVGTDPQIWGKSPTAITVASWVAVSMTVNECSPDYVGVHAVRVDAVCNGASRRSIALTPLFVRSTAETECVS